LVGADLAGAASGAVCGWRARHFGSESRPRWHEERALMKLLTRWLLLAAALLLVAKLYPGVTVTSFASALVAALVLGLLNTLVRPLLVLLTLPVTLLTLGLFLFVINALMFWSAASVLSGLAVTGFGAALIGSLLYSACGMVIDIAIESLFTSD
jgi:putative membrane protein